MVIVEPLKSSRGSPKFHLSWGFLRGEERPPEWTVGIPREDCRADCPRSTRQPQEHWEKSLRILKHVLSGQVFHRAQWCVTDICMYLTSFDLISFSPSQTSTPLHLGAKALIFWPGSSGSLQTQRVARWRPAMAPSWFLWVGGHYQQLRVLWVVTECSPRKRDSILDI